MLQPNSYRNSFRTDFDSVRPQQAVNITGGMTGGQYHWAMKLILVRKRTARVGVLHGYTCYLVATKQKMGHLALETNFAPTSDNRVAHRLNHRWKAVGSDVGMSINKDGRGSAMLAKNIQNLLAVASFLAAGVKFAV